MTDYALRRATADDSSTLYALHRAALGPYIEAIYGPWDEAAQADFHRRWFSPERVLIIEKAGLLIGVVDYEFHAEHLEVNRISIHPAHQNEGIGAAVLTEIVEQADRRRIPTSLEVFDINPARRLYARLGFVEVGSDGHKIHMVRTAIQGHQPAKP